MPRMKKTASAEVTDKVPARRGRPPKNSGDKKPVAKKKIAAKGDIATRGASAERAARMRAQIADLQVALKSAQADLKASAKREKQLGGAVDALQSISSIVKRAMVATSGKKSGKKISKKK